MNKNAAGIDDMNDIVWSEFHKRLRAYVSRRVNSSAVDDVVSEILLRLVRSQVKMDEAKSPVAWIYRVAANVITDHYRRSASEKRLLETVFVERSLEDLTVDSDDTAASLADCLIPMIKSLPAPYDQALMLTEIDGVSQTDASSQLGLSVSGMKSRVQRGRQKLKERLIRCCDIETNREGSLVDYKMRGVSTCCN